MSRSPRVPMALAALALLGLSPSFAALPVPAPLDLAPSVVGQWEAPRDSQVEAIHAVLLPTGKVLYYSGNTAVRLLDPATGGIRSVNLPWNNDIFCSGHVVLADGRVLVMGGTLPGYFFAGEDKTFLFDPWTETWSQGPRMSTGRWYPTPVVLGDGRVAVFSGLDATGATTPIVEVLDAQATAWQRLAGAERLMGLFPRISLLPSGELLKTGHEGASYALDPATRTWRWVSNGQDRWFGSSVLLPGLDRVLVAGGAFGSNGASSTTSLVRPTGPAQAVDAMTFPRTNFNLVLLPDGDVVANGGTFTKNSPPALPTYQEPLGTLHGQLGGILFRWPSVLNAELFDTSTAQWSVLSAAQRARTYHGTSLLLPDGRVFVSGSDVESDPLFLDVSHTYEMLQPPNLFQGPRPGISSAPASIGYGAAFPVGSPDAADVDRVTLVRLGSATHAFNFEQRLLDLGFTAQGTQLMVTGPPSGNHAPPGYYMLFLLRDGVPSVARIVRLA